MNKSKYTHSKEYLQASRDSFIDKANKKHNGAYDYSLVEMVSKSIKVKIICKTHGIFEQRKNDHLQGKGCLECSGLKRLTTEKFINKSNAVHGNKYDYSLSIYKNNRTKIKIICAIHGVFTQTPDHHMAGFGCNQCSYDLRGIDRRMTLSHFLNIANNVHGNKYDYSKVKINGNNNSKITIICKDHGEFDQSISNHLSRASGCKACAINSSFRLSGYMKISERYNGKSNFYIIECFSESERFYKVGITVRSVGQRYSGCMPYKYKTVLLVRDDAEKIFKLEKYVMSQLKCFRYIPSIEFGGSAHECFFDITENISDTVNKFLIGYNND